MKSKRTITVIINREENDFVAHCPELDIASQGATADEARTNLIEAVELFFETASPSEIQTRFQNDILVTKVEVSVGSIA